MDYGVRRICLVKGILNPQRMEMEKAIRTSEGMFTASTCSKGAFGSRMEKLGNVKRGMKDGLPGASTGILRSSKTQNIFSLLG